MTSNQIFLQGMLYNKALTQKQTIVLWNFACTKSHKRNLKIPESGAGLDDVIAKINRNLEITDLKLNSVYNFWDKQLYFGVVNTEEDYAVTKGTKYAKKEIIFFERLKEEIMELVDESFVEGEPESVGIMLTAAQNLAEEEDTQLKISEAGDLIQQLNKDRWLHVIKKHGQPTIVTFGIRSLLELPDVRRWSLERQGHKLAPLESGGILSDIDEVMDEAADEKMAKPKGRRKRAVASDSDEEPGIKSDAVADDEIVPARPTRRLRRTNR